MAGRALEGTRVVELGPYVALPLAGRILASLGAEVVKVETNKVLDEMAFIPAWSRGAGQPDYQRGKRRVTIDVRTPQGREVLLELIAISDVFMTNFRRNILDRWGIDFPVIRQTRPDIIIMWQTGLGGHGPYYTYKPYGILVQHMSGVSLQTGLPGASPGVVNSSYSDYHTGVFQPAAVIGALMRRRGTGRGATMESSVFKSGAATVGPGVLDYQFNDRLPRRLGNRDPRAAPHGVYPCAGEDRYCAIAVFSEEQWRGLGCAMGDPDWTRDFRFAGAFERLKHQDELDGLIAEWTRQRSAEEVMAAMQSRGVPASIVSQGRDLHESAHLAARGFYRETRYYTAERRVPASRWQPGTGTGWTSPMSLSGTPLEFGSYSNVGEDNAYVFGEILAMPAERIRQLTEDGVLY